MAHDLGAASIEIGHVAAPHPGETVVDLTGLDVRDFSRMGMSVSLLAGECQPHACLAPHPHFPDILEQTINDSPLLNNVTACLQKRRVWL